MIELNLFIHVFYLNRDVLNLLKTSPAPKAAPAMAAAAPPSPVPTPTTAPPPPGSRPNVPPLSVPGKPGAPVRTPHTISRTHLHTEELILRSLTTTHLPAFWLESKPWWGGRKVILGVEQKTPGSFSVIFKKNTSAAKLSFQIVLHVATEMRRKHSLLTSG